ncbi:helix-turn-helix transcriptional regulator [Streptomyces europaeiscabiei]|uniref:Helix-turn-helix transcriptional regulator n=1 Tax=Streptomyces europaeiscabiei TaxID=146819 RepID=A0ABU4NGP2_9ACTN|nr:helix-turn-helix transcriptional regulator [Streptomyces europaeiscabiei]MDX3544466.1 helix-turn-helix transcriptional regulator [Streptomyces europaeiscabiei]MDX3553815.1 helix-turn-helix transcriptional regulator [Streptomyces europaeiscabiei]MDX3701933.1 helix-turn-helix transcriptional regulator [Streptomyces europaeiscabiei]
MHTVGELLRQWRHRRRLSQLDLSLAADVSARHVSLVETGKSHPSAAMVLRLADQLDVPLRDRNRLLLAAGFAPRYAERPLDDDALTAARSAVERVLRAHEPYPALAFDRRWNIVMTNRAVEPFFADVDPDLLRPPVNLIRLGLDPRGFAPLVVNLADVRAVFRSRITRQLALAPDAELTALYEELLEPDPENGSGRSVESDVVIPMILRFDGRELRLFSTITTFGTPMDITLDEVAIESYYPADTESAAYFEGAGSSPPRPSGEPSQTR